MLCHTAASAADMTETLIGLARQEFEVEGKKLTDADIRLFTDVVDGKIADFSTGNPESDNPTNADAWGEDRILSADRIVWLCTNKRAIEYVTYEGLSVKGALIEGTFDLNFAEIPFPLFLEACRIKSRVLFVEAETRRLEFTGTHVDGIEAAGINVRGGLSLTNSFTSNGEIRLIGARIEEDVEISGGRLTNKNGKSLDADLINVIGGMYLNEGFSAVGEVRMYGATIGGSLECTGGTFSNEKDADFEEEVNDSALALDRINISGGLYLNDGFTAVGEVRMIGATIGGNLVCRRGKFENNLGHALSADNVQVANGVFLNDGFRADGSVRFPGASIDGILACYGGTFASDKHPTLVANDMHVSGGVFLNNGFNSNGIVHLNGTVIEGNLECRGGLFSNEKGVALNAKRVQVTGNVHFDKKFTAVGEVRLMGATVGGDLVCSSGWFNSADTYAFSVERAQVRGSVFLNAVAAGLENAFNSVGEVRLNGATIGGDVNCSGGRFKNTEGKDALSADNAHVGGTVFLNSGFTAKGEVALPGMVIDGDIRCSGGNFVCGSSEAFTVDGAKISGDAILGEGFFATGEVTLHGATIGGELKIVNVERPGNYTLDLTDASVGSFSDEKTSWPKSVHLNGFEYKRINFIDSPELGSVPSKALADRRRHWLERNKDKKLYPQPYEQLASVLQAMGHKSAATEIRIAKERAIADNLEFSLVSAFSTDYWWYKLFGWSINWGYDPWWAFVYAGPFWVFGGIVFGKGYKNRIITPLSGSAYETPPDYDAVVSKLYPNFYAVVYSLDTFVPIIDFGQARNWTPNPDQNAFWGKFLLVYLWIHILMGWVLSTLLVIGFSGIVRD